MATSLSFHGTVNPISFTNTLRYRYFFTISRYSVAKEIKMFPARQLDQGSTLTLTRSPLESKIGSVKVKNTIIYNNLFAFPFEIRLQEIYIYFLFLC